jgi:hypothetical protein
MKETTTIILLHLEKRKIGQKTQKTMKRGKKLEFFFLN